MKFYIDSFKGALPLFFNMNSNDIEKIVNIKPSQFKKTEDETTLTDDFGGFHVFYDSNNLCEAIEIFNDNNYVQFNSSNLFEMTYKEVEAIISTIDGNLEYDEGFTSYKLGISIYCPSFIEEPDSDIEAILVFRDDYYSK